MFHVYFQSPATYSMRYQKTINGNVRICDGWTSGVPKNFVQGGGFQQIQLRTEDREKGDLGVVAP